MSDKGWISIHRQILQCVIWDTDEPYTRRDAWIFLLLKANHEDKTIIFDGQRIEVKKGQYLTSVRKLSGIWHWGKDKTLKYLKLLEQCEMIIRNADSRKTLITIVNYDFYQGEGREEQTVNRQLADSEQTVSRHSSATNNNVNNENNKKEKNKKENPKELFERLLPEYSFTETMTDSLREWYAYKTERKDKFVERGMRSQFKEIQNYIDKFGDGYVTAVINKSMSNGWAGLFWDSVKGTEIKQPQYKTTPKEKWDSYMWSAAIKDKFVSPEDYKEWKESGHVII